MCIRDRQQPVKAISYNDTLVKVWGSFRCAHKIHPLTLALALTLLLNPAFYYSSVWYIQVHITIIISSDGAASAVAAVTKS